ncbi:DUF3375 domain-containing protein [Candidatus Sororendozoicomonas aggregata]|uniref:DUF3375 domain-containing protein n=1 Tax=Candidatus Sororendozoicomonas aggregata TaxID=3073239 RepID=UPI002ECFDD50
MNFQGLQAQYQRLYKESKAWRLLRAETAPMMLAFLADLFSEESEIPFERAQVALGTELARCRERGIWDTQTPASTYLNQWVNAGWLRLMNDKLSKTDASDTALQFCKSLEERGAGTTASHLRIVQEAVRDFAVATSLNKDERMTLLEHKKAGIQREIDKLNDGIVVQLSDKEQRERIREIYQLASVLTGDFRRMEDDIRELGQAIRIQILEGESSRGDIITTVLKKEAFLATTDAGSAFEGFFQLLCDQNRSMEFREQLHSILNRPVAKQLTAGQQQFLGKLMRNLNTESNRVLTVRRRTEEGLRSYIESGAAQENRIVDKLLGQLERAAVSLKEAEVNLQADTGLSLPVGPVKITSPQTLRLRLPDEKIDTSGITENVNSRLPSQSMLQCLDAVQIRAVAKTTQALLKKHGPLTVAGIAELRPVTAGLEELVAYIRVAQAVNATELGNKEPVTIQDKQGKPLNANIPGLLLSAELFPDNIDDLVL